MRTELTAEEVHAWSFTSPDAVSVWRRAMTRGFMPEGATFNGIPNILPPSHSAKVTP